ncbi:MAG: foldase protein PrsA [Candidatus Berkelbacteria bacterium Licking1014_7]|uniref:Foldase protein PrsA n=1 Tax=Candidatus Berkelbacteria bacterium Licking1014_7 TaxID=2017147 RepID=A0A554LIU3_9BACT|nr:MAG: foldase protein PrsA [Candidatus Berkelbacteria bacterium Licking1014_7]
MLKTVQGGIKKFKDKNKNDLIKTPWFLIIVILIIYLMGTIGTGAVIYGYKTNSPTSRAFLIIFPLPAVIFDSSAVSVSEVFERMNYSINFNRANKRADEPEKDLRKRVVEQLIEDRLYLLGASRINVVVTSDEVQQAFDKVAQENGGVEEVKNALLSLYGMNEAGFKKLIKAQVLKDKVRDEAFEQVKLKHILVADEETAKKVIAEIQAGKKFEDAAREFSKDETSRDKGGEVGWVRRGQYDEKLDEVIFNIETGKLSETPVQSNYGWQIILVEEKKGSIAVSLEKWLEDLKSQTRVWRLLK